MNEETATPGCHMTIMNTGPRKVKPTHPGEMLREDFMPEYGLTVVTISKALGASRQTINELLRERRAITPVMALKLSRLFGNTPEFWLNAQRALDLWEAETHHQKEIEHISPLHAA
jgi:addiction module HigA family antidote